MKILNYPSFYILLKNNIYDYLSGTIIIIKVKRAVAECIKLILSQGHPVYLKSIGTLKNKGHKRKRKKFGNSTILISTKKHDNREVLKLLIKRYHLNKQDAKKVISAFSSGIKQSLSNYKLATLPDVAILSLSSKKKVSIHPLTKSNKPKSKNPKTAIVKPSAKKKASLTTPVDSEALEEIRKLESLTTDLPQKDELKSVLKDHFYQEDDILQPGDTSSQIDPYQNEPEKSTYISSRSNAKTSSFKNSKMIGGLGILLLGFVTIFSLIKFCSEPSSEEMIGGVPIEKEDKLVPILQEYKEEIPYDEAITSEALTSSVTTINPTTKEEICIIITGSFSDTANEQKMTSKILQNGYEPYSEYNNGFVRVGVQFECPNEDLTTFLHEVRNNIDSKAWYL